MITIWQCSFFKEFWSASGIIGLNYWNLENKKSLRIHLDVFGPLKLNKQFVTIFNSLVCWSEKQFLMFWTKIRSWVDRILKGLQKGSNVTGSGEVTPWPGDTTIRCVQWEVSDTREPAFKVDRMIYPFLFSIFFLLVTNWEVCSAMQAIQLSNAATFPTGPRDGSRRSRDGSPQNSEPLIKLS